MADAPEQATDNGGATDEPAADLGDAGKKALDEERKARRDAERQLKELQAQIKSIEDKDESEVERLREELNSLQTTAAENEARALRAQVALTKGLTPAQAKRLVGSTLEELEADADEMLEAFKPAEPERAALPSRRPAIAGTSTPSTGQDMALNGDPLENALRSALGIR